MAVDEKTNTLPDWSQLKFPASLPVRRIEVQDYTDSTGEPSLRVQVVLDESFDADHISGHDVGELKWIIREALRKHGISKFAYIFMARQSELDAEPDAD